MHVVYFCHSLVSDWNHGNAHFLRGLATEVIAAGHSIDLYEPADGWSAQNLRREHGERPFAEFRRAYPGLSSSTYSPETLDLDSAMEGADLALVHEWSDPELVERVGEHRRRAGRYRLLFHDTHHRSLTAPAQMANFDLSSFDGALVFGDAIAEVYRERGWTPRVWTWHEGADVRVFRPLRREAEADLVWIGNWGDEERTAELEEFLIRPVRELGLSATAHGVRYPEHAVRELGRAGIEYRGWLPNFLVPQVYAKHRLTLHIPRRPYVEALPGIPTIRVFEALSCGMPLICSPWSDSEGLFAEGDYPQAADGREMTRLIRRDLEQPREARLRAAAGRSTILRRHTCAHRVAQLLRVARELGISEEKDGVTGRLGPSARKEEVA